MKGSTSSLQQKHLPSLKGYQICRAKHYNVLRRGALVVSIPRVGSVSVLMAMGCVQGPRMLSLFFFLWCLRMPMLPVFMKWHHVFRRKKKKTNILNMFTENCLLYIHIIIYLFYSQCALHNQDIGFVAFCPCSHPKLLQPFCKDIYRRWTVTVSFSAVSNGLLVASTK